MDYQNCFPRAFRPEGNNFDNPRQRRRKPTSRPMHPKWSTTNFHATRGGINSIFLFSFVGDQHLPTFYSEDEHFILRQLLVRTVQRDYFWCLSASEIEKHFIFQTNSEAQMCLRLETLRMKATLSDRFDFEGSA